MIAAKKLDQASASNAATGAFFSRRNFNISMPKIKKSPPRHDFPSVTYTLQLCAIGGNTGAGDWRDSVSHMAM